MRLGLIGCVAASVLVGCAFKSAPVRITVKVPENFSGQIRLMPCKSGTPDTAVSSEGVGITAACPTDDNVEIVVVKGSKEIHIPREAIQIDRTGDRIPLEIKANVE